MHRVAAAALALLLAPLPAAAQSWYRINVSSLGVQYVDLDSIVPQGDFLRGTELTVLRTRIGKTDYKYVTTVILYDCRNRSLRLLTMEGFDRNNASSGPFRDAEEAEFAPPEAGSPGEVSLNFICNVDRGKAVAIADPLKDPI